MFLDSFKNKLTTTTYHGKVRNVLMSNWLKEHVLLQMELHQIVQHVDTEYKIMIETNIEIGSHLMIVNKDSIEEGKAIQIVERMLIIENFDGKFFCVSKNDTFPYKVSSVACSKHTNEKVFIIDGTSQLSESSIHIYDDKTYRKIKRNLKTIRKLYETNEGLLNFLTKRKTTGALND